MSNLILPQSQVNQTLENNLNALFKRYPHERSKLESILRKPAPSFPLEKIPVPEAPSKPPIRILLLLGIGNPVFLASLLNDLTISRECFKLFIFEQDPEYIAWCFQNADLCQIINAVKSGQYFTEWFICNDTESLKSALFIAMKPEAVTALLFNVQELYSPVSHGEGTDEFYNQVASLYNETCHHVFHNHGNTKDSLLGVEVTLKNKDWLLNCPGIHDLKDHYRGCSALIVGAGPSLEPNLEMIKKYNDRYVVIAADAALKPLLAAGIRVDFCTSIERLNAYQKPFFEGLQATDADLVALPVLHPDVLSSYPGQVRVVYRNYGFFAYFEKAYPKGVLRCGGSTSHLGLRLADYFGCRKAFFIGLDSCYEEKDGLYRSHSSGTGHPDWGQFIPLKDFEAKRRHQPALAAMNNSGQKVMTNMTYYQWIKEYSEELAFVGQRMAIKNCSAIGLPIAGVPYIPLEDAVKDLDLMLVEKPKAPPVTFTRRWDNKDILKNFQAWSEICVAASAECDDLAAMEQIDLNRMAVLQYILNFRLIIDDVFVAFVIQCCAFEFFELENQWWALSLDADLDLKEKLVVLKRRFALFNNTLNQLVLMFVAEGKNGANTK